MIHLDFIYKYVSDLSGATCMPSNIDDALRVCLLEGITEVRVNRMQMLAAAQFAAANAVSVFASEKEERETMNALVLKIIKEGALDQLMGVRLVLET